MVAPWIKESTCNVGDTGDLGSIPGSGRSPGEGHDNPLQYSCLENSMDRAASRAIVHRVARSQARLKQLSMSPSMCKRVIETEKKRDMREKQGKEPKDKQTWDVS